MRFFRRPPSDLFEAEPGVATGENRGFSAVSTRGVSDRKRGGKGARQGGVSGNDSSAAERNGDHSSK